MSTNIIQTYLSKYRLYAEIALVVVLIVTGLIAWHYYQRSEAAKQTANMETAAKSIYTIPVTTEKLPDGHIHTGGNMDKNTFSQNAVKNNPAVSLGGADTAAAVLGIQREQIMYWMQVAEQRKGEKLRAMAMIDSLKMKVLYYQDKFIRIAYHPGKDSADYGTFDYKNNEHLTITQYTKRNWFLGANHRYIDIMSDNPNTTIAGVKALTITPDQSNFAFKGQLRAAYDFASGRMIPSAGIVVTLGNFDVAGRYYYNYQYQKFTPIVSAAYNVINIK